MCRSRPALQLYVGLSTLEYCTVSLSQKLKADVRVRARFGPWLACLAYETTFLAAWRQTHSRRGRPVLSRPGATTPQWWSL